MTDFLSDVYPIIKRQLDGNRWTDYSLNRLTRRGAGIYVEQHGIFTRHSRRCWAYVVGQCPEVDVRRFIVRENLYEEEGVEETSHFVNLQRMGVAVGLTPQGVESAVPLVSTRAALLIWETLTKDRHWLIGCVAKAALEQLSMPEGGEVNAHQGRAWMRQLGLSKEDVDFWLLHDEADRIHGPGIFLLVNRLHPKYPEVSRAEMLTAVEDSVYAWALFWNGIADAAEAPELVVA
jgi:pyrroloquinoline quinone (PQQ) biosynthesis protein C